MTNGRRRNAGPNRRIQDVRIADSTAGSDGTKIDRMITHLQTSESQIRVLCGDIVDVQPGTTQTSTVYGFASIIATDDFQSVAQQYEQYRITAIKFDVYDINPLSICQNVWSTFHNDTIGSSTAYTRAQILDGPDSRVLSSGTGQTTFYWRAHGVEEMRFQGVNTASTAQNYFGGLRWSTLNGTAGASQKYEIVIHAVVDFRGRL